MNTYTFFVLLKQLLIWTTLCGTGLSARGETQSPNNMKKRILFVVTSHNQKGSTGEPTGFYLSEVAHPWALLVAAGYEIDFVSPKGGKAPVDGRNLSDPINRKFWYDPYYRSKIEHTLTPTQVDPLKYVAVHVAGGHGAMWDLPGNKELGHIIASIYENNGVVSAVCHGPAALVNVKLRDGRYLVDGKKVNAFTNEEEVAVKLDDVVPFLLESRLIDRGARFEKSGLWQPYVVTDGRLVTGQNPQSAEAVGRAMADLLSLDDAFGVMTKFSIADKSEKLIRKLMTDYVLYAQLMQANLMAEAYYEEKQTGVLWLIERWKSEKDYKAMRQMPVFKSLEAMSANYSAAAPEVIRFSDLEPLSKNQWRQTATKKDQPITIMLFVDAKPGTEDEFMQIYHQAMPAFRGEPGVVNYQLSRLLNDSARFVTYEKFRSQAAFDYHLNFPPIRPVIDYLRTSIRKQPFEAGLHRLIEFAPMLRQ